MEDTTLKVLIVHDEKAEANRLISLLRNANYKPEAKHTDQDDVLSKLLQERPWDIALCQMQGTNLPAKTLFSQIRRQNLDLPVILIIDEYDPTLIVEGLRQGAADVVVMDHDQHILQVISRSLQNLNSRRLLRRWKNKFNDSEKRAERLLHNSRNAIAIVQEGTFLYANDSYARMLGHPDGDSLTCLPVIDTVADGDQEGLMPYLRHIESDDVYETREIAYTAMTESGSPVPLRGIVSMVEFEGEPALEFMVPMNPAEELNGESTALASASSIQLNVLFETIAGAIRKALQHISKAALLHIEMDQFKELRDKIGVERLETLITELANALQAEAGVRHSFHRYKENQFFVVMQNTASDAAIRFAKSLCEAIAAKTFAVDGEEQKVTISVGISIINDTVASVEGCMERSANAIANARKTNPDGNCAALFESDGDDQNADIETIGETVREFLDKGYFKLSYQPVIALHGDNQEFYEVLTQVSEAGSPESLPEDFIARVYNTPEAHALDRWVILQAVKRLKGRLDKAPNTRIFINISAATLCDDEFLTWLKVALKASGVATSKLIFQLREIDVTRYFEQTRRVIGLLKSANAEVALSRFGLSIEPMKLIEELQFDYVKLDNQLLKRGSVDEPSEEVLKLINGLKANSQNIIVPFVESAQMIPELWQHGVHYIQGYFLQQPSSDMNYDFQGS